MVCQNRDEDLVKECSICMERRADSATCGQLKHRVCSPCLVSWMTATPADEESDDEEELPYDGRKHCPSCRAPILADYERDLKNAAEEKSQPGGGAAVRRVLCLVGAAGRA